MRLLGESLGVPISVFGPDTHITKFVPLASGIDLSKSKTSNAPASSLKSIQPGTPPSQAEQATPVPDANETVGAIHPDGERTQASDNIVHFETKIFQSGRPWFRPFDTNTRSFVYGLQPRAIQSMLVNASLLPP